jgi:hypothetical protein
MFHDNSAANRPLILLPAVFGDVQTRQPAPPTQQQPNIERSVVERMRARSKDINTQLGPAMLEEAGRRNLTLSQYLEREDPSREWRDGMDAFQRQLMLTPVVTNSVPEDGIICDHLEQFAKTMAGRILFAEWAQRVWRTATGKHEATRAAVVRPKSGTPAVAIPNTERTYVSTEGALNTWLHMPATDPDPHISQIQPQVPLNALLARTQPIDGDAFISFYLTDPAAAAMRWAHIPEGSPVPRTRLTGGDHAIRTKKFGRALEATYETLRRVRIDLIRLTIARMAMQAELDKVAAVIDVVVNGDGNSNTSATVYNLTTLDPAATAGTLTLKGWIKFKAKFVSAYRIDTVLAQEDPIMQLLLLSTSNANIPLVTIAGAAGFGGLEPLNNITGDSVRYGLTADAPASKLVGIDTRLAIQRIEENGSNIQESFRWIENQTELLVMTENEAYSTLDQRAVNILNIAA